MTKNKIGVEPSDWKLKFPTKYKIKIISNNFIYCFFLLTPITF